MNDFSISCEVLSHGMQLICGTYDVIKSRYRTIPRICRITCSETAIRENRFFCTQFSTCYAGDGNNDNPNSKCRNKLGIELIESD